MYFLIAIYTPIIFLNLDSQNQFQSYILSYTNKYIYFGSILIFSVICSYVEFFISFILIYNLSDSNSTMGIMITTFQIINFIIISLPSILFFVSIGILLSNFLTKFENIISFLIFVFLFISFGSSTFIPVDFYPEVLSNLISDYNLIYLQYNQLINILGNNNINLGLIIITLFLSVFFPF